MSVLMKCSFMLILRFQGFFVWRALNQRWIDEPWEVICEHCCSMHPCWIQSSIRLRNQSSLLRHQVSSRCSIAYLELFLFSNDLALLPFSPCSFIRLRKKQDEHNGALLTLSSLLVMIPFRSSLLMSALLRWYSLLC